MEEMAISKQMTKNLLDYIKTTTKSQIN